MDVSQSGNTQPQRTNWWGRNWKWFVPTNRFDRGDRENIALTGPSRLRSDFAKHGAHVSREAMLAIVYSCAKSR